MSEQSFDPTEWVTTTEAAEMAKCTPRNLTRAISSGELEGVRRGHMFFFKRTDILDYIQRMNDLGTNKHTPKAYRKDRIQ